MLESEKGFSLSGRFGMGPIYELLKERFILELPEKSLLNEKVLVKARALSTEEAIGNPEGDDFPLQKGKERLMQAEFKGAYGQAFTDRYGNFEGTLNKILNMPLNNNFRRAILIATMNAVLRQVGKIDRTIHCRDQGPSTCALELVEYIKRRFSRVKILQVGFQPRMVEALSKLYTIRVLDLDVDNIGLEKFGVIIEGPNNTQEAIEWADMLLVTGTTIVNDTIYQFLVEKPVVFYGTTIACAAYLMGWERFCHCAG